MDSRQMETGGHNTRQMIRFVVVVIVGCVIVGLQQGVHDNYGIMMNGLIHPTGLTYEQISFCIGVGALVYGFAQPVLGMLALRTSNAKVMLLGVVCMVIGLVVTPLCTNFFVFLLFFGLILPFGTTGLDFGIIMSAITPILGEKRAAMVSGLIQASAGIGDALLSPTLALSIADIGVRMSLQLLTVPFFVFIPLSLWIGRLDKQYDQTTEEEEKNLQQQSMFQIIGNAFKDRDYLLLVLGFATCGFNMSIIESHIFSQFLSFGIPRASASIAMTIYGIATMTGATVIGILGTTKFRMKNLLGSAYAMRVVISLLMILVPLSLKKAPFAFLITALLGMCGDATVPPTSGIITHKFGAKKMPVLYGFTLIGHQFGAFASSYLGGVFVAHHLGYTPLWIINACLASFAATVSFMIKGDPLPTRLQKKAEKA